MQPPEPNQSVSHELMAAMALCLDDFAGRLAAYYTLQTRQRRKPLQRKYNQRGEQGYRLVVTSTTVVGVVQIRAHCSDPYALGLLLDYLDREYEGASKAKSQHKLHGEYQLLDLSNPPT